MPPSTEVRRTLGRIFDCQTKRYGQPRHVVLTKFRSVLGCFDATFRICYFHFRTLSILPLLRREDEAVDGDRQSEETSGKDENGARKILLKILVFYFSLLSEFRSLCSVQFLSFIFGQKTFAVTLDHRDRTIHDLYALD